MAMTWSERGYEQGQRELLRIQVETLFGPLTSKVQENLAAWPADKLLDLGRALLTCTSLREVGLEE
jgi:hypothetical protein